jgi:hypothetical protein
VEVEWATKPLGLSLCHVVVYDELNVVCVLIHVLLDEPFDELFVL